MNNPRKWRSLIATGLLAAVTSTVLVASVGEAAEARHGSPRDWVGSWAAAVTRGNLSGSTFLGLNNQSVRLIVHGSVGGSKVRIRLTNLHGEQAVTVGHATVAKPDTTTPALSDVDASTIHELTFGGSSTFVMPKGAELLSDPVDLPVGNDQDLVVSVFFPTPTGLTTFHSTTRQNNYVGPGDLASDPGGAGYTTQRTCCWFFLSGVDVLRKDAAGSVIVFGDSLADGHGTTFNGNLRWPDQLFDRLQAKVPQRHLPGVLNISRGGARLTHEALEPGDGGFSGFPELGDNAFSRLNEDVFSETGAHAVIMDLGINDIWMNNDPPATIIAAIRQLNQQIRQRGYTVIVGTLGPFNGLNGGTALVWTPEKEATRNAVNDYLRTHRSEFDAVVDFDKIVRDPADPTKLKPEYDGGDHIHPNDAGSKAMAAAIPLNLIVR
ncbi:GDSL-type esterase/lipase family protein [Actinophytocola sp.]|jgi:lysophospholipase L1-like esterase|uniref:GDSL-type esterase/lipase family protein n=1 Tax=Actinophytocola sp. TaxID=1872138 RepID=UPI002D59A5A2|nr:GDSL-type esterase/lipase family protein [Actinophytocola sp.]HYQ66413.1 GDSL-type esterase/lipase family protein [Actinophytocola sp.]